MPQYTVTSTRTFKQIVTYRVNSEDEDTAFDLINAYDFRGYHAPIYGGPDHPDVLEIVVSESKFEDEFIDSVIPVN